MINDRKGIRHHVSHPRMRAAAVSQNDPMESSAQQIRAVLAAAHEPFMLCLLRVGEPEHAIASRLSVFDKWSTHGEQLARCIRW